ncbi:MAG: YciI family protein [Actinomycetota bacterium]
MPQYLLSVHHDYAEALPGGDDMQRIYAQVDAVNEEIREAGAWVFAGGLTEPGSATVVRMVDGDLSLTDGPFAETKEHLGGFWIIAAPDLDAALAWARKATVACEAPVEVRPFQGE